CARSPPAPPHEGPARGAVTAVAAAPATRRAPLIAVAGALPIASSAILVHQADVHPATAAVYRCAYALPLLGLLAWRERRRLGPRAPGQHTASAVCQRLFSGAWRVARGGALGPPACSSRSTSSAGTRRSRTSAPGWPRCSATSRSSSC